MPRFTSAISCALVVLGISAFASTPQLQVLHTFLGGSNGNRPSTSLIADSQGNLYGTTMMGGSKDNCLNSGQIGCGVVFELSAPSEPGGAWKESILYRFTGGADGATPQSSLVFDSAGNLYGTAVSGGNFDGACGESDPDYGCGVVFELSPQAEGSWTEQVIYSFTGLGDGAYPAANVTFDSAGNLYGTIQLGGQCQSDCGGVYGYGTVFELTPNGSPTWNETTLYAFQYGSDGGIPQAGVVFDQSGNLYGTSGAVFELTPPSGEGQSWTFSTIGYGGPGGLTFDSAGNLYGASGGTLGAYELSPSGNGGWKQSTLYTFNGRNYDPVGGVVFDSKGHMYGSLEGTSCGGLYRLEDIKGAWTEAEMDFYTGHSGPCGPEATPIFGKWGAAYGTSVEGGSCSNGKICGTVFGILP